MGKPLIVKLKSYVGEDTYLHCGGYFGKERKRKDYLYMVVDSRTGEELDIGYRSKLEARKYWPDAIN